MLVFSCLANHKRESLMRFSTFAAVTLLFACSCVAQAQDQAKQKQPTPEEMKKLMDATMGAMIPVMGRMTEVMLEAQLKVAERPETADMVAAFKKNLYEALMKKGFSPEQAMQLTLATAMPSAMPSAK
jgi:hypothetical protein